MRPAREELEQLILQYVTQRLGEGLSPTVREICDAVGIKSTSTAHKYLKILEEKGFIKSSNNLNRSIQLAGNNSVVRVPLVGQVAAGQPILAAHQITDYIPFSPMYKGHQRDLFALNVRGDSMINAAILDGDIIICQQTPTCDNGEIVVAMVDDEATVKRFYKEKGRYRLQPENDNMDPIIVDEVSVLGRVISVIRMY